MLRATVRNRVSLLHFVGGDIEYTDHGIPIIDESLLDVEDKEIIPVIHKKLDYKKYIGHFYIDDFQFERFWVSPQRYINYLQQFYAVFGIDFSTYTNMPLPVLMYNLYRNALLTLIWQRNKVNVIPNITWPIGRYDDMYVEPYIKSKNIVISNIGLNSIEKHQFEKELRIIIDKYSSFNQIIIYGTECKATSSDKIIYKKQYIHARRDE